ncbi:MAG: hypothetical protein MJ033_07020 [Victivallaceae bacterium]|nr:hypothetical protein [Victivallaceae bacterium]
MSEIPFRDELRRKLVHLSSFWMPVAMIFFRSYRWQLAVFFGFLALGSVLVEHAYARGNQAVQKVYNIFFNNMLRQVPNPTDWVISGGPPVLAASCAVLIFFPPVLAAGCMALMLGGDTAAALIGRRFGHIRFANGKSLEGVIAFILIGALAFGIFFSFGEIAFSRLAAASLIAAVIGALAEFFEKVIRIDDNFGIPVFAGLAVQLFLMV